MSLCPFFFSCSGDLLDLPSFPTRRSSDLVGAEVREPRRRAPCARRHLLLVLPCEHLRDAPDGVPQRLQLPLPRLPPVAEAVQQIGGGDDLVVGIVQGGDDALDVPCEPALARKSD